MSTANFSYQNRCVVVSNDDLEIENTPELSEHYNGGRNFPSRQVLLAAPDLIFWEVVLTYGYYQDACIDYISTGKTIDDYQYFYNARTNDELFSLITDAFSVSKYCVKKIFGKRSSRTIEQYIDDNEKKLFEYLIDLEEAKVNKAIDYIKEQFGYSEYMCAGRFSNGEAMYEKI